MLHRIAFAACLALGVVSTAAAFETVARVDLDRYDGLWYEIARLPNSFEDANLPSPCYDVTAEYASLAADLIRVVNTCTYDFEGKQQINRAEARAVVVDTATNAKLAVNFIPVWQNIPFLRRLASGPYWIVGLGPVTEGGDYSWAVVVSPTGADRPIKYAWILARDPMFARAGGDGLSPEFVQALDVLGSTGVVVDNLVFGQKVDQGQLSVNGMDAE